MKTYEREVIKALRDYAVENSRLMKEFVAAENEIIDILKKRLEAANNGETK